MPLRGPWVNEEFVKKVDMSGDVGPNSRGRPPARWRDRVKEYMCERGATRRGRAGSSKKGVFGWGEVETFLLWLHPCGTFPGERGVRALIDRQIDGFMCSPQPGPKRCHTPQLPHTPRVETLLL